MLYFHKNCIVHHSYERSVQSSWHLLALGVKRCAYRASQALTHMYYSPVCAKGQQEYPPTLPLSSLHTVKWKIVTAKRRNLNRNLWIGSPISTDFLIFKNNLLCTQKRKEKKKKGQLNKKHQCCQETSE